VTADVLTLEGLRQRRLEILRVARKRKVHRIAVVVPWPEARLVQTATWIC
jgi:hypothetical protein